MIRLSLLLALLAATTTFAQTLPAKVPTTGPAKAVLDREVAHLAHINERLKSHPKLVEKPYVRLELALANRFIDRITTGKGKGDSELEWKLLQMDEVGFLLKHTEETIDAVEAGRLPETGLGPVPTPTGGPVKIVDGVFVTDTTTPADPTPKQRPFYFGGYGHFQQIVNDLPNFPALGVTLVQDGRNGPDQGLSKERTLTKAGLDIKDTLDKAAKANVKVDILTSPHYFPAWAGVDVNDINNPKHREVIEQWLTLVAAQNKDAPALLSYCLSNEPMYGNSGRDGHSAPAWHAFLKDRHKTIDALNKIYEKQFKSFDEVPAAGWTEDPVGRRHAYDWVCFNDQYFAGWHKWMGDVLKKNDPRALTHAKIMVFFSLDYDKLGTGIDPEQFCLATDIAGCDAYAQMIAGVGPLDETTSKEYAYHWQVQQLSYDLLHSFRNQPVFNSENHPIENSNGAYRYPANQSRAVIWQGGLHHQGATTTWVWEEGNDPALMHSIYFRPAYCWGQQRALLDLNRLSEEVTAINRAEPTVAILYSPASRFWQKDYATTLRTVYTALNFMGETITFVSERQIAAGEVPKSVRAIVLPHATHLTAAATAKLLQGKSSLIYVGKDCMTRDEYDRPSAGAMADAPFIEPTSEREVAKALLKQLPPRGGSVTSSLDWGVEYRFVKHGDGWLIPLINHLKQPQTVTVSVDGGNDEAVELLSGQIVSLKDLKLDPMIPMLLKIGVRKQKKTPG